MPRHQHQLLNLVLGDAPDAWEALGFAASGDDPGHTFVPLGNTTVVLNPSQVGFAGWAIEDANPLIEGFTDSSEALGMGDPGLRSATSSAPTHPNGITGIDHVVVATGDLARTTAVLEGSGIDRRGGRTTDSYGKPMSQAFFWLGDVILELVGPGPEEPTTDDPVTLFGLALVSKDLEATVSYLGDLAGSPKDAVQAGRQIAGIRGQQCGVSIPLAVMSPHPR